MTAKRKTAGFTMPARPAPADVDSWVAGAPAPAPAPAGKLARLTIDLDPELHAAFKVACAIKRVRMVDIAREAIAAWVRENGKT